LIATLGAFQINNMFYSRGSRRNEIILAWLMK